MYMTHETEKIMFSRKKASNSLQCSRTLLMNVPNGSARYDCERNSCKDWFGSKMS